MSAYFSVMHAVIITYLSVDVSHSGHHVAILLFDLVTVLAGKRPQLVRHEPTDVRGAHDGRGGGAGRVEDHVALRVVAVVRPVFPGGGGGNRSLRGNSIQTLPKKDYKRILVSQYCQLKKSPKRNR